MCDKELLVGYLYDEVDGAARRAVEGHLKGCGDCRAELHALRATRTKVAAWAPPDPELAFQVIRGARTPRASLWSFSPAWGLAAAAVLVLAAAAAIANLDIRYGAQGLVVRTGWTSATSPEQASAGNAAPAPAAAGPVAAQPPPQELIALVAALSQRISQLEAAAPPPAVRSAAATIPPGDMLRQVRRLLSESENRQQQELALRITQVLRDVDGSRRQDAELMQRSLAQVHSITDKTMIRQRDMENYVFRVAAQQK